MLRILVFAFALGLALPLRAGEALLPAYFDVVGVAENDVLFLREKPDAASPVLGQLSPHRRNVEIVGLSEDGKWGQLTEGEGNAWVTMRYLKRVPGQADEALPEKLSCFGSEPFWVLRLNGESSAFDELDGKEVPLSPVWSGKAEGQPPTEFGLTLKGADGAQVHAVIGRGLCSDGMSERTYGYSIRAILSGSLGKRMMSGCCTLP